jgi:hypothetical protein
MQKMLDVDVPPDVIEGFKTYFRKKQPKYKLDLSQDSKKILNHYISFVEKVLAPSHGLHNLKLFLTESPTSAILFCQKLPNTSTLWVFYKEYSFSNRIPISLRDDFPNLASYLKKIINENKPIIDSMTALSLKDTDCNEEWTHIDIWEHILSTTTDHISRGDPKEWKTVRARRFLEDIRFETKKPIKIPSHIYRLTLSNILRAKLVKSHTDASFVGIGKHLIPVCHIYTLPQNAEFLFPDLSTEKNATINIKKIDEFNRTTNEYLEKVYKRIKTTVRTFLTVKNLLY